MPTKIFPNSATPELSEITDESLAALLPEAGASKGLMPTAAVSKLSGIQSGATSNQSDSYLLNRANHTGEQAASTITGLAAVATSGVYEDLSNKPTLGTASSQPSTAFATSTQGGKADSAIQSASAPLVKTGTDVSISAATTSTAGSMSAADKTKLDKIADKREEIYSGTTNSSGVYSVTFGTPFPAAPNIQVCPIGGNNKETQIVTVSATGFTVKIELRTDVLGLLPSYSNVNGRPVDVRIREK